MVDAILRIRARASHRESCHSHAGGRDRPPVIVQRAQKPCSCAINTVQPRASGHERAPDLPHCSRGYLVSEIERTRSAMPPFSPAIRPDVFLNVDEEPADAGEDRAFQREGLPPGFRMRHDAHYVDQLTSRAAAPQVRLIPLRDIDPGRTVARPSRRPPAAARASPGRPVRTHRRRTPPGGGRRRGPLGSAVPRLPGGRDARPRAG